MRLITSVFIDLTREKLPSWIIGTIAAAAWTALIFGFSSPFFDPEFQYGMTEMWTRVLAGTIGGLFAGGAISLSRLCNEQRPRFNIPVLR